MSRRALIAVTLVALTSASTSLAAPPPETVDAVLCRGLSGVGFSYAWGGECWCGAGCAPELSSCSPGVCKPKSGSTGCPECTHTGTYGADCSGFVSKAWQVPEPYTVDACGVDRYVAASFTSDHKYWSVVPMSSLQPADAVANSDHVVLVIGAKDPYGEHEVVEAKGCNYGIIRQSRTFASSFSGARRISLSTCVCQDGDEETKSCGDCGTQARSCKGGCQWSEWSPCDGPDPMGAESSCTVEGGEGACAVGKRLCAAGWLTCQAASPSTEVCDGQDNDCDGIVDNGTPSSLGEGLPCESPCGGGQSACIEGEVRCVTPGSSGCDEPTKGGGANGGGAKDSGTSTESAEGSGGARAADEAASSVDESSGCACRSSPQGSSIAALPALLLLGLLGRRRRRR